MKVAVNAWFNKPENLSMVEFEVPDDFVDWTWRAQDAFLEKIILMMRNLEVEDLAWEKL